MKGVRIRLTLNNRQRTLCAQHAGVARHAYNWAVVECEAAFRRGEKTPSAIDLHRRLIAEVKTEHAWYYDSSKCAPQQALHNLQTAYENFHTLQKKSGYKLFEKVRENGVYTSVLKGLPQFKKKGRKDSFYLDGQIHADGNRIKVPRLGWLRLTEAIPDGTVIKNVTISRKADHWFLSYKIPSTPIQLIGPKMATVGVDLGIKTLATLSTGKTYPSLRPYKQHQRKLRIAQRKTSKKFKKEAPKQSKNYLKAQRKVARIHARVANIRAHATHQLSHDLAKNHGTIVIEDLHIRGMSKNHRLASAILDGGWYEFRRQLSYKAALYGAEVVVANRFFASSKTCSCCGHKKAKLDLKERTYQCEVCGFTLDRDLNAAINLQKYATASYAGIACGATNNRVDASARVARK